MLAFCWTPCQCLSCIGKPQNWMQYSSYGLTNAEHREIILPLFPTSGTFFCLFVIDWYLCSCMAVQIRSLIHMSFCGHFAKNQNQQKLSLSHFYWAIALIGKLVPENTVCGSTGTGTYCQKWEILKHIFLLKA